MSAPPCDRKQLGVQPKTKQQEQKDLTAKGAKDAEDDKTLPLMNADGTDKTDFTADDVDEARAVDERIFN